MHVFYLDNGYRLIKDEVIARGSIDSIYIEPRQIIKRAVELHAARYLQSSGVMDFRDRVSSTCKNLMNPVNLTVIPSIFSN